MRPRGQTPRMLACGRYIEGDRWSFNEAAGADPADATWAETVALAYKVLQ